ncbi:Lrp/AsnC ligand binding domain-containing protein, partial [Escherichia coli]|uniref:Lrp/AsnC ligand binding domain-containing protein n=1 Tax=Escherichia coli TaxID=562 RepID=UPI0021D9966B
TESLPKEELVDFYNKLKDMPEVTHITKILGNFDVVLTIVSRDGLHFDEIVENIKRNPKKIIEKMEVATITSEDKLN